MPRDNNISNLVVLNQGCGIDSIFIDFDVNDFSKINFSCLRIILKSFNY